MGWTPLKCALQVCASRCAERLQRVTLNPPRSAARSPRYTTKETPRSSRNSYLGRSAFRLGEQASAKAAETATRKASERSPTWKRDAAIEDLKQTVANYEKRVRELMFSDDRMRIRELEKTVVERDTKVEELSEELRSLGKSFARSEEAITQLREKSEGQAKEIAAQQRDAAQKLAAATADCSAKNRELEKALSTLQATHQGAVSEIADLTAGVAELAKLQAALKEQRSKSIVAFMRNAKTETTLRFEVLKLKEELHDAQLEHAVDTMDEPAEPIAARGRTATVALDTELPPPKRMSAEDIADAALTNRLSDEDRAKAQRQANRDKMRARAEEKKAKRLADEAERKAKKKARNDELQVCPKRFLQVVTGAVYDSIDNPGTRV